MNKSQPMFPVRDERLVAGCMSGTSIDGIDTALVRLKGHGLEMKPEIVRTLSRSLGGLAKPLRNLARQQPMTAAEITELSHDFAQLHLELLRELLDGESLDLVALHGQTVYHRPPLSWQLINPNVIACGLKTPVVFDLRAADLVCGGQGAPITPIADFIMFKDEKESRSIINLGGFCNITRIGSGESYKSAGAWIDEIDGFDLCVCNQLLDRLAVELIDKPFDEDGLVASTGSLLPSLFDTLSEALKTQLVEQRSLGTGDELWDIVADQINRFSAADVLRTACAAVAATVTNDETANRIILAGGGVRNQTLISEIRARSGGEVSAAADDFGVPAQYREAAAMAILGGLCQDRAPITFPSITGAAEAPISGNWALP